MAVVRLFSHNSLASVVIVGAGISGLTAAYRIRSLANQLQMPISLRVLESSPNTGGVIRTLRTEHAVIEEGPEALVTHKPAALNLIEELGLTDRLIACSRLASKTFIASGSKLEPLPEGFVMFAPTRLAPLAMSSMFSLPGKLRMALDLVLPRREDDTDESLAAFVQRRLGREALDRLAEPLISGIYSTDPHNLSAEYAVPRLRKMEREHGSIIRGLLESRKLRKQNAFEMSPFLSLDNGMQTIIEELVSRIGSDSIALNTTAVSLMHGLGKQWRVVCGNGAQIECDAVVLATPASVTAKLLSDVAPQVAEELGAIRYGSTAMLSLVFNRDQVGHKLDGSGFVVPSADNRVISACSFSSIKFKCRTNENNVLLRLFCKTVAPLDDEQARYALETAMIRDVSQYLNIIGEPLFKQFTVPRSGLPKYEVGHKERVERIFRALTGQPGLALAGNCYFGVGISDCITSAELASQQIASCLGLQKTAARASVEEHSK